MKWVHECGKGRVMFFKNNSYEFKKNGSLKPYDINEYCQCTYCCARFVRKELKELCKLVEE